MSSLAGAAASAVVAVAGGGGTVLGAVDAGALVTEAAAEVAGGAVPVLGGAGAIVVVGALVADAAASVAGADDDAVAGGPGSGPTPIWQAVVHSVATTAEAAATTRSESRILTSTRLDPAWVDGNAPRGADIFETGPKALR